MFFSDRKWSWLDLFEKLSSFSEPSISMIYHALTMNILDESQHQTNIRTHLI